MLELDDLALNYSDFSLRANFSLAKGARTAVIGPSGAGKSTMLAALAGFLRPASGRILFDGTDITNLHPGQRPFALIFQDNNLFPNLTALQNAGLGLKPDLRLDKADRDKVMLTFERLDLNGSLAHKRPSELSGGQQSRVALARALLQRRHWLLLDEPFSALGPAQRRDIIDLVAELCDENGSGLLMVTHLPEDALRACSEAILVADGRAHPPERTEVLLSSPPPPLAEYLGQ